MCSQNLSFCSCQHLALAHMLILSNALPCCVQPPVSQPHHTFAGLCAALQLETSLSSCRPQCVSQVALGTRPLASALISWSPRSPE
jgi:hypothetical protein